MRDQCIQEVMKAAGRPLNMQEVQGIEARILRNMKTLAQNDRSGWQAKSESTRMTEAAAAAAQELVHEAQLKKRRIALTIAAHDRIDSFVQGYKGKDGKIGALKRTLAFFADARSDFLPIETRANATKALALSEMQETFEATNPKIFGLFEDQQGVRDLVYEIWGVDTGNAAAKSGAKAWLNTAEGLRRRFNDAGGDIGKLDDWSLPQHHSQDKVSKAGPQQWGADIAGKLDRSKYVNPDGTTMDNAQLQAFLTEAWKSIATGGVNKLKPGGPNIGGSRANRGNETRQIHLKNPQAYLDYQAKYGDRTLWEVMARHIEGVSKDIALVETYGPNPDHVFNYFLDTAKQDMTLAAPEKTGKVSEQAISTENLYNFVAGKTLPIANQAIAQGFDTLRNLMVASRLGSAVISSLSDVGTLAISAKVNNLPALQLTKNVLSSLNPANQAELRIARRAGLAMETLLGSINRWGSDTLGPSWSSKAASSVIRASGLNALSDAQKRAYGVTMMGSIGQLTRDHSTLSSIDATDNRILLSKGITEQDWTIWKMAQQEDWGNGNGTMLTPESIMRISDDQVMHLGLPDRVRFEAARKLLGTVLEEVDMAIITPGARDRLLSLENVQRGTWKGELTRSFFLFKTFPLAMVSRHWARGFNMPTAGGKAGYLASIIASTTILGAISMQISELLNGKNPRNMAEGRFWLAAALKGGALGLYGDFLFSDQTQAGRGIVASLMGPAIGAGEEFIGLTQGNLLQLGAGEDTDFGAELVRMVKGLTPGANLWYTKAATDHLIFHNLQEYFSPGYLRKMEKRARSQYGQSYWWRPGEAMPDSAPDLSKATGK
ncbi:Uncharacterised protein [Yersinia frederiksenii]|nr:Uncharacterised protein [Yersinia frederiksenii]